MSNMRPTLEGKKTQAQVIAVIASDIHLRLTAPPYRAEKDHWLDVTARHLEELYQIADECEGPIIYAGDIFNRWDSPPELINFALKHLPCGFAIPGQHDLPHHRYDERKKSAYWTLVEASKLEDLPPYQPIQASIGLTLHGFPYGHDLHQNLHDQKGIHLAVIHDYVWTAGASYDSPPEDKHFAYRWDKMKGFNAAVFGDNHLGFEVTRTRNGVKQTIFNCGGFMRHKSDEKEYRPAVGLLYSDGSIRRRFLASPDKDEWIEPNDPRPEGTPKNTDLESFLDMMQELGETTVNFSDAINRHLRKNKLPKEVASLIQKAVDKKITKCLAGMSRNP